MITREYNTKEDAISAGYLGYNQGTHRCVELTDETTQTITVKLPNGRRVSFGFVIGDKFSCVDVADDTLDNGDNQKVSVMGRGPTFYSSKDDNVTITSISLRKV